MRRVAVVVLLLSVLLGVPAFSKLSAFGFERLVESQVIVIGQVSEVSEGHGPDGRRIATLRVDEVLKGGRMAEVRFNASALVMDDASQATVGESVLLFLVDHGRADFGIAAFGRGYMPIRVINGSRYATYWGEVTLPAEAPIVPAPEPHKGAKNAVPLEYMKRLIASQRHARPAV
jgi:hypothetical protein